MNIILSAVQHAPFVEVISFQTDGGPLRCRRYYPIFKKGDTLSKATAK